MENNKETKRINFIKKYSEFDKWLLSLQFKTQNTSTYADYHYLHYDNHINSMYGIEHYYNEILNLSIRFIRDSKTHKFMIVGGLGNYSDIILLNEFKNQILTEVKTLKLEQLNKLKLLNV